MRHHSSFDGIEQSNSLIHAVTERWDSNSYIPQHTHQDKHQLIFSKKGTIKVQTEKGYWILPPSRAIWIEQGTPHSFYAKYAVEIHILYIKANIDEHLTYPNCCVFNISSLVKQLVETCLTFTDHYEDDSPQGRLSYVLLEQLQEPDQSPVNLPIPENIILKKVCQHFENEPSTHITLVQLSISIGASERTIERLFLKEMGLSYNEWRYRFRLIKSLEYLAENQPITEVAYKVGYTHVSSYIVAFRKLFGCTPRQYFNTSFFDSAQRSL